MLARKPVLSVPEGGVEPVSGRDPGALSSKAAWAPPSSDRSFAAFDAFLCGWAGGSALCVVVAPTAASTSAVAEHVARRMAARAVPTTRAFGGPAQEGFRELARALASGSTSERSPSSLRESPAGLLSSREVASAVMQAALEGSSSASCFIVEDGAPTRYALAVATEVDAALAAADEAAPASVVVWIVAAREGASLERLLPTLPHAHGFEIGAELDATSVAAYWSGAQALPHVEGVSLDHLSRWWRASQRALVAQAQSGAGHPEDEGRAHVERLLAEVSAPAARLARVLGLIGRPLPLRAAQRLAEGAHLHELERAGLAEVEAARVAVSPVLAELRSRGPEAAPIHADEAAVAVGVLLGVFAEDPWACMRAAEIGYAAGSSAAHADEHALRALTAAVDADSRIDLWARFDEARFPSEPRSAAVGVSPDAERLLPFVDLALRKGDGDWALRLARRAVSAGVSTASAIALKWR